MPAKNPLGCNTPSYLPRKPNAKGVVREPAYSIKEICQMFGISSQRFIALVNQHPLRAALNVGKLSKGRAVYPLSAVKAWGEKLGL